MQADYRGSNKDGGNTGNGGACTCVVLLLETGHLYLSLLITLLLKIKSSIICPDIIRESICGF